MNNNNDGNPLQLEVCSDFSQTIPDFHLRAIPKQIADKQLWQPWFLVDSSLLSGNLRIFQIVSDRYGTSEFFLIDN